MSDLGDQARDLDRTRAYRDRAEFPVQAAAGPERVQNVRSPGRVIDAGRLWIGGVMAGVVAAGVAVVGLLVARGILNIPVLVERKGHLMTASTWWYAVLAFLAAVVATALLHGLLAAAPQPYRFFSWIFGLAVAIAVLVPFTSRAGVDTKLAVAVINLAIGVSIGSIVSSIGRSAARILDEPYGY